MGRLPFVTSSGGRVVPTVFQGSAAYPGTGPGPIVTIGNFDGVHLGHQALIAEARARSRATGAPTCVLTFEPAPRDVLRPDNDVPRIQSLADKIDTLGRHGVDHVVVERFDLELAAREPGWFADEILGRRLRCSGLVLGWDFRFGRKRLGTADHLRAWLDVPVDEVSAVTLEGTVVSSSRIRQLVRAGEVAEAARLLTRPHRLRGEVVRGDRRGRQLGFPTANVAVETPLQPARGVYAVRLDGRAAVANLGVRPTFEGGATVLEVHVLDVDEDLYGTQVAVDLVARIRDERAFTGADALAAQIRVDVADARALLS